MLFLSPRPFPDYQLLDTGDFEKLERFGNYVLIRPEPQAVWSRQWSLKEWEKKAHVRFIPQSGSSGRWNKLKSLPDQWKIKYTLPGTTSQTEKAELTFRLGLTGFKHVGIFPEQAVNWDYIYQSLHKLRSFFNNRPAQTELRFLNLFAYTGGASLAACAAGAEVTHVDSVKQVITWARENMDLSGLRDVRWVVEDALTFVKRELKRGRKYHGIILDPPAYGHGPKGESWKLEDQVNEMMKHVFKLLDEKFFIVLNTYSLGFSPLIIENIFSSYGCKPFETGELFLPSESGQKLPLGVFGRAASF